MTQDQLDTARLEAAEREWIEYDLGEYQSEGQDRWEWTVCDDTFTRRVYLASDGDAPSAPALVRVRFVAGSAEVAEARVSLDGRDIGRRGIQHGDGRGEGHG
ncbi:MAG: hypothetical protein JO157_07500 [Acetobacteraceae bacterium]|nr:hypothetical protein [Acetobacteraceae bacterium]